jgi:D-alanyl-D-alanine carboxypeptidase
MTLRSAQVRWWSGAVAVALVAGACAGGGGVPDATTSLSSTTTTPTTSTNSTSSSSTTQPTSTTAAPLASPQLVEAVGEALDRWRVATGVPGAGVAISLPDGTEINATSGVRDILSGETVRSDEFWRVASITKPMVSVAVLRLAAEGILDLDAPVARYLGSGWAAGYVLDGVDYGDLVTIADLLGHTAGFKEYAFDPGFYLQVGDRLDVAMSPQEVVQWAVNEGPQSVPGTRYLYNTVGHVVAGLVIEAVTGRPAEVVLRDEVFGPAGAVDLYLTPREFPPSRVPAGYVQGLLRVALDLLPALVPYREQAVVGDFYDITAVPQAVLTSAPFTGGGIEGQLDDVARVFRAMFDGSLLASQWVEAFTTPVLDTDYGLGITVGSVDDLVVYSHGGGVPGFRSHAAYVPELDVSLAISSNLIPVEPDVGVLADEVMRLVRAALAD